MFGWRVYVKALPSSEALSRCIAGIDMSCVICGAFHESDMHALFECVMEKMIWEVTTVKGLEDEVHISFGCCS